MPYLGNIPATQFAELKYQDFTGGTGTSFTLNDPVGSAQELEVFVNNVRQEPGVAYTVSGTTLTMTGSIVASDDFYVVFQGKSTGTATHPAGQALTATDGTFTGDLTVDTNTLHVDAANNKVGVGITSPQELVHFHKSDSGSSAAIFSNSTTGSGSNNGLFVGVGVNEEAYIWHYENEHLRFGTNGSERGRFLAGGGLTFNGDTAAANALDDYEEGTWDPSVGGTATYTDRYGKFQKVGNIVHVQFKIEINNIGTGSANILSGFPFTSANLGQVQTGCVSYYGSLAQNVTWVAFYIENNATTAQFVSEDGTADPHLSNGTAIFGNAATLFGAASYFVS